MTTHLESDSPVISEFARFEYFCKALLDAYVLLDHEGKVLKCNQLFTVLVAKKTKAILKAQNLDELLNLSIAGVKLSVSDLLQTQTPTRLDEVHASAEGDIDLNLILGIYPFIAEGKNLGAFVLLRDVTAETNLQDKYKVKATQSITDKLTGLYNRTYFEQYLPTALKVLEKKAPSEQEICVMMIDIDHFKQVNDGYGHAAGDIVLQKVAKIIRFNFRKTDVLCRYGGEEFLAILPATTLMGAVLAAEKLRKAVETNIYEYNGVTIPVTISLGLAQVQVNAESGEEAIARADAALYYAKKNGRNRVCIQNGESIVAADELIIQHRLASKKVAT